MAIYQLSRINKLQRFHLLLPHLSRHFAKGGNHQDDGIMREVENHMASKKVHHRKDEELSNKWSTQQRAPYRFRLAVRQDEQAAKKASREGQSGPKPLAGQEASRESKEVYSDYAGLRFPSLDTAENYDYNRDRGFDRIIERAFPIKVPGYRRLDPYFREYIWFLHNLDPARFTISRIAKRYRLREKTVAKVVQEWATNQYLTRSGLTKLKEKQQTREAEVLRKKEEAYAKWVGWDQLGDEDDPESDDEALGESKGWRSTSDWVRRQSVEVEMMSAFPMMEKRDPMPKRVDVDMVVDSRRGHKIINWIDPTDKVVF